MDNWEEISKLLKNLTDNPQLFELLKNPEEAKKKIEYVGKVWSGYEQVKSYGELMNWAVRTRFETLPAISALAATLLVIATFNDKLIVLDNFVRFLLSILLILIPGSLWGLFYEASRAEDDRFKKIYSITEENAGREAATELKKLRKPSLRGAIPLIVNIIFTIIVLLIILLIWKKL